MGKNEKYGNVEVDSIFKARIILGHTINTFHVEKFELVSLIT